MQRAHYDYWLLCVVVILVAFGVVMVYSASAVLAAERYGDAYFFLKKQLVFVAIGCGVAMIAARVPYAMWRRAVYPLMGLSLGLALLAYVPGLRSVASGAARWVRIGPFTFQPSELVKIALVVFLAYSLEKKGARMRLFSVGVLPHLVVGGLMMAVVMGQRDFGSTFIMGSVLLFLLFAARVRLTYLVALGLAALPLIYFAVARVAYRRARILAFLDPWSDRYGSGFQIIQSLISFYHGGVWGRGLGEGQQKLFYLPEAHTDFIAAVLAEELGLVGLAILTTLFIVLTVRGLRTAWRAPDGFGRYLALGITALIAWQTIANLSVVMGLLPTKGMVLPFISYGGSALLATLFGMGILLNVSSYAVARAPVETAAARSPVRNTKRLFTLTAPALCAS